MAARRISLNRNAGVLETLEVRRLLSTTFHAANSAEFTSALNNSQLGDTIVLDAGTTYTGWFTLPVKSTGSGWITIESSNLASLPVGNRVSPADAANMPRIQSGGNNGPAITAAPGSHNYQFLGIEFVGPANNSDLVNLVQLGTSDPTQNTIESMPYNFKIDRSYFHPNVNSAQVRRAIALNSGATDVTNCYIAEIHQNGSDSQAIGGSNGSGPYNILNNYLEAASENILFGGSGSYIPNTIPSNIVIRGNYVYKPTSWMGVWDVKNLFELKVGSHIDVEGNIFENNWNSAQDGTAIVLKLDQWSSARPWQVTEDITFQNNIIRHSANAIAVQGRDYTNNSPDGDVRRLSINNNLFDDINKNPWAIWKDSTAIGGNALYITQGPHDLVFTHNTIINGRTTINCDSSNLVHPATGFVYENNLAAHNTYGVFSSEYGTGDNTITNYFDVNNGDPFTKNVLMGGPSSRYVNHPGNYFPASWSAIGFVDQAHGDYHLAATSPYKNAGTDGKDIGADIDAINTATATAMSGIVPDTTPPQVTSADFEYNIARQDLAIGFSESVVGLDLADVQITNSNTGAPISASLMALSYDDTTHVARITFPGYPHGALPDGNYRASIAAGAVTDHSNNPLAAAMNYDFFFLAGDANHDRTVDVSDLGILATNWQQSSRSFSEGDFNYDSMVDVSDLGILATNWQKTLAAPAAPAAPSLFSAATVARTVRKTSLRVIDQVQIS